MPLPVRARPRAVVVAILLLTLVLPAGPPAAALPMEGEPVPVSYRFGPSGLDGAGFQNVVAFSPFRDVDGHRPLLLGGDIAGVHRSLDGGRSWTQSNAGLPNREVSALLFSAAIPGKVYAATDTGLAVSTDFGIHWSVRPAPVDFDANGTYRIANREHPRPTGTLLAQDPDGILYAATASQGIKRSADDGTSWDRVALAGLRLRTIALDPADADRLFVGDADGGLHVSTDARTAMTFTRVAGSPTIVEELEFVGGVLYVAAGAAGVHRYDGSWRALTTGLAVGPSWQSLTGYVDADGRHVLLVGCSQPKGGAHTMRSDDGGQTWTSLSSGTGVTWHDELYGSGRTWWARAYSVLDPSSFGFVASDLAVDPDDPARLVLAGRAGAYVAVRDSAGTRWWPAVDGLMATVNVHVVADPRVPGRVHVANVDWRYLPSADHGTTFHGDLGPGSAATSGDVIALDLGGAPELPAPVYLASSQRGINTGGGALHSNPDPLANPTGWTDEQLPVTADVGALAVGRSDAGDRVVLAAVGGQGLYRKVGGDWTRLAGELPFATRHFGALVWEPGTAVVYAHDTTGVWRSGDAGAAGSWVRLAAGSAGSDWTGGTSLGSLAIDPALPGSLYVSATALGGVARIRGADTGTPSVETILPLTDPGPIALTPDGALLVVDRAGARLLRADSPAVEAPVFVDVGDGYFAANNASVRTLAVDADGHLYTASIGGGVSVATPPEITAPPPAPPADAGPPTPPTDLHLRSVTSLSATLAWTPATDDVAVTDYEVLRDGDVVGVVAGSDRPAFVDTGLLPDTVHAYQVRARDAAGSTGPAGDLLQVTTAPYRDTSAPTGPASLRARLVSAGEVALDWPVATDDTGVTGYRVTRDGVPVADVAGLSWTDAGAPPGPRAYRVSALDAAGNVATGAGASVVVPAPAAAGLTGTYFDTATFTTQKLVRVDPTVDFSWWKGRPASTVAPDTFSVRWTGRLIVPAAGRWTFITLSDEAVRLWVGGTLVVDHWTPHLLAEKRGVVRLAADRAHDIRIEFQERTGVATMRLLWAGPGVTRQVLPSSQLLAG